jgi:hypothetical protein
VEASTGRFGIDLGAHLPVVFENVSLATMLPAIAATNTAQLTLSVNGTAGTQTLYLAVN